MTLRLIALMVFLACLGFGCTSVSVRDGVWTVKKSHRMVSVGALPENWHQKRFRDTDLFFDNPAEDASIYLSSNCEKVSDSPLEALTAQMLVGMGKYEITSQTQLMLSGRAGLVSEVKVVLDGVERYLKIMVLRKNRCVFDAVLSARHYSSDVVKVFDDMIASLKIEADL